MLVLTLQTEKCLELLTGCYCHAHCYRRTAVDDYIRKAVELADGWELVVQRDGMKNVTPARRSSDG